MRRAERNLGEKRVLLGSLDRKNNLRLTYERLNLEEKAFISSTKFYQRQLLSRQTKLRQLQSREQGNKSSIFETGTSFPGLDGANEGATRGYFTSLTPPYSRNGLTGVEKGNGENTSLSKDRHGKQARMYSSQRHSYGHNKALDGAVNYVSTENRHETNVFSGEKEMKDEKILKSSQLGDPQLNVDDIIAYATRYGRRPGKSSGSSTHRENGVSSVSIVEKQAIWKGNFELSTSTEMDLLDTKRCAENEDMNPSKLSKSFDKNFSDVKNRPNYNNSDSSLRLSSEKTESARKTAPSENEPWVAPFKTVKRLSRDNDLKKSDSLLSSSSRLIAISSTLENQPDQETSGLDDDSSGVFTSEHTNNQATSLVSRTPSWHVTEALPALGRIRRGSFCDVKTFTSGKVLDLLSTCEIPNAERKSSKSLLEVESENLKYCRYLRSVTPEEAAGDSLDIPLKYRPSKNIIIGHTKVSPQLKDFQ